MQTPLLPPCLRGRVYKLFGVMKTHRKDIYIYHAITDGIHQTVFIGNTTAPDTMQVAFQWLRFSNASERMLKNVFQQFCNALHDAFIASCLPIGQVFFSFRHEFYFHISSSLMTRPRPSSMSFSPWRMILTISGEDMIYSVSSIACFFADNFLRYLTAFFIKFSSSAMMLSSRNNSAFNCNAVITSKRFDF